MNTQYAFTDKERAYIEAAQNELRKRISTIVEINIPGFTGRVDVLPDNSGLALSGLESGLGGAQTS